MKKYIVSNYNAICDNDGFTEELNSFYPYIRVAFIADEDCEVSTKNGLMSLKANEVLITVEDCINGTCSHKLVVADGKLAECIKLAAEKEKDRQSKLNSNETI